MSATAGTTTEVVDNDRTLERRPTFTPWPFAQYSHKNVVLHYLVVGCGGTGSYLVRDLARFVAVQNEKYGTKSAITLCDGDVVEERNLIRQNFIREDVGRNKAEVLAERYGNAFGITILAKAGFLPVAPEAAMQFVQDIPHAYRHATGISSGQFQAMVMIGCVDNTETRHVMSDMCRDSNWVLIDAGNTESIGQTVVSCRYLAVAPNPAEPWTLKLCLANLPSSVVMFEMPRDARHPGMLSCADHAEHQPQAIGVNILSAQSILTHVVNFEGFRGVHRLAGMLHVQSQPIPEDLSLAPFVSRAQVTRFNAQTGTITLQDYSPERLASLRATQTMPSVQFSHNDT
jgi:hypothetical protein